MARKNKDIESLGFAILLLVAMCTGIFFLFKWLIAGIIAIISVIAVWAINLKKKNDSTHYPENSDSNAAIAAGLFAADVWNKRQKNKEQDEKLEKEMDIYGLEDWQKEEVRNGNYDPWSFEEEYLEGDDYYHDDSN